MRWHDMGWTRDDLAAALAVLAVIAGALLWRTGQPTPTANRLLLAGLAVAVILGATVSCHITQAHTTP